MPDVRREVFLIKIRRVLSKPWALFWHILYASLDLALAIAGLFLRARRCDTFLIIRLDGIGDFTLFRNFIRVIRQSPKYSALEMVLLGNEFFRTLTEYLDGAFINKFIWIDVNKYRRRSISSLWYTFFFDLQMRKIHYHSVFCPVFSRTHSCDELVRNMRADHKITCSGDIANKFKSKDITARVYTDIILTDPQPGVFEFDRHREIISKLLCEKIELDYPIIEKLPEYTGRSLPPEYIAVCMEASLECKKWPDEHFSQVIDYILNSKKLPVVLLGLDDSAVFADARIINLRGKTTLPEAACVLNKASCFIGNDSALLHIAAASGIKKLIAVCYGAYYGRFAPYPEIKGRDYRFIFPPEISQNQHKPDYLKMKYANSLYEDIKLIKPEQVIDALDSLV